MILASTRNDSIKFLAVEVWSTRSKLYDEKAPNESVNFTSIWYFSCFKKSILVGENANYFANESN